MQLFRRDKPATNLSARSNTGPRKAKGVFSICTEDPFCITLVPETGFELVTFALRMRCSTN